MRSPIELHTTIPPHPAFNARLIRLIIESHLDGIPFSIILAEMITAAEVLTEGLD